MYKTVSRLLPCPVYDVEAVESWLGDLAGEGLYLERQGNYFGLFHFRRGEARALPYRLVSSLESTSIFFPSLITLAMGEDRDFKLSRDFSAFSCCTVPRIAFMIITAKITIVLSTFPDTMEIRAATIRMITRRSLNCEKKIINGCGGLLSSSSFFPSLSRR